MLEIEDGLHWEISVEPDFKPIEEYLSIQGRFRHLEAPQIELIKKEISLNWKRMRSQVAASLSADERLEYPGHTPK